MGTRILDLSLLDVQTRFQIIEMEREKILTSLNYADYWNDLLRSESICYYDDDKLVGLVSFDRHCPYFGGSTMIKKILYRWDCNQPFIIAALIRSVAEICETEYICMDIDRRRDINRSLYLSLGFEESLMHSAVSADNVVLISSREKLLSIE